MRLEQLKGNLEGQIRAVTGSGNTRQTSLLFAPPALVLSTRTRADRIG
jgi:hypothetical protein